MIGREKAREEDNWEILCRKVVCELGFSNDREGKVACDPYMPDERACFPNLAFRHYPPLICPPSWKQDFPVVSASSHHPFLPHSRAARVMKRTGMSRIFHYIFALYSYENG